jgi:hypothetical protein
MTTPAIPGRRTFFCGWIASSRSNLRQLGTKLSKQFKMHQVRHPLGIAGHGAEYAGNGVRTGLAVELLFAAPASGLGRVPKYIRPSLLAGSAAKLTFHAKTSIAHRE